MEIKEYMVVNDEEFHPQLKIKHVYNWNWNSITTFTDFVHIMIDCFNIDKLSEEYVYIIAFNEDLKLLGIFNVAHGTHKTVFVGKREVFIFLLLVGATKFIMIHNHPDGSLKISNADIETTEEFVSLGEEIEIELIDHVVVTVNGYHFIIKDEKHSYGDKKDPEFYWALNKATEGE